MTTFTGYVQSGQTLGSPGNAAAGFADVAMNATGAAAIPDAVGGPVVENRPFANNPRTFTGSRVAGMLSDFYGRIIIEPGALDLGNVLAAQVREVVVWNSTPVAVDVEAFGVTGGDGVTVDEPDTPVYTLGPMQQVRYVLTVNTTGPATIAATLGWLIDGVEYECPVTGRRLVLWPIPPNWQDPVTETLEWRTDVIRAFDGSEQRRSLQSRPRWGLEYSALVSGDDTALLDRLLWGWQNRTFAVPLWFNRGVLTATAGVDDDVLNLSTDTLGFVPGAQVVLFAGTRRHEIVEVAVVSPDSLELARPLLGDWPAGTPVYPILLARLADDLSLSRRSAGVVTAGVSFTSSPDSNNPAVPVVEPGDTYLGLPLLLDGPNWKDAISVQSQFPTDSFDPGFGPRSWSVREIYPRTTRRYPWQLRNRQAAYDFKAWLGRMTGMLHTCWVPTWHADFRVLVAPTSGGNSLTVTGSDFGVLLADSPMFQHVMLRLIDGTNVLRAIAGVSADVSGDTTTLTFDDTFDADIPLTTLRQVCLLTKCRLGSDKIEIPWHTTGIATPTITFTTTPE